MSIAGRNRTISDNDNCWAEMKFPIEWKETMRLKGVYDGRRGFRDRFLILARVKRLRNLRVYETRNRIYVRRWGLRSHRIISGTWLSRNLSVASHRLLKGSKAYTFFATYKHQIRLLKHGSSSVTNSRDEQYFASFYKNLHFRREEIISCKDLKVFFCL